MISATSRGSPSRPSGIISRSALASSAGSVCSVSMRVRMAPGQTVLTRMPSAAPKLANILVITATAPLVVSYSSEVVVKPPS